LGSRRPRRPPGRTLRTPRPAAMSVAGLGNIRRGPSVTSASWTTVAGPPSPAAVSPAPVGPGSPGGASGGSPGAGGCAAGRTRRGRVPGVGPPARGAGGAGGAGAGGALGAAPPAAPTAEPPSRPVTPGVVPEPGSPWCTCPSVTSGPGARTCPATASSVDSSVASSSDSGADGRRRDPGCRRSAGVGMGSRRPSRRGGGTGVDGVDMLVRIAAT
jgi:hypothetical protein